MKDSSPDSWDMKEVNKWWQRGINKEQFRHKNSGKPYKGDRFSTRADFSNFAPTSDRSKDIYARNNRKRT